MAIADLLLRCQRLYAFPKPIFDNQREIGYTAADRQEADYLFAARGTWFVFGICFGHTITNQDVLIRATDIVLEILVWWRTDIGRRGERFPVMRVSVTDLITGMSSDFPTHFLNDIIYIL